MTLSCSTSCWVQGLVPGRISTVVGHDQPGDRMAVDSPPGVDVVDPGLDSLHLGAQCSAEDAGLGADGAEDHRCLGRRTSPSRPGTAFGPGAVGVATKGGPGPPGADAGERGSHRRRRGSGGCDSVEWPPGNSPLGSALRAGPVGRELGPRWFSTAGAAVASVVDAGPGPAGTVVSSGGRQPSPPGRHEAVPLQGGSRRRWRPSSTARLRPPPAGVRLVMTTHAVSPVGWRRGDGLIGALSGGFAGQVTVDDVVLPPVLPALPAKTTRPRTRT